MISLSKMNEWFQNDTENSVKKVRQEIQKRIELVKASMEELELAAQDFEIGDTIDAETRSSQNIFEKMTEMVTEFEYPEKITYKTTEEWVKSLGKFLQRVLTIGRRFIPNLKRKYKTRVFILNRALTRIQKNYHDFNKFIEDKTVLLKEVDETSDKISLIISKVEERDKLKKQISSEKAEADEILKEISELDNSTTSLESREVLTQLDDLNKKVQIIGKKLRLELGGMDKPLRKLTSRAQDGKVMVPPELVNIANLIRENPLDALWEMDEGHEKLNDLMEILIDASKTDKIKLKASMKNKAIAHAQEVINGSIKELHLDLISLKEQITNIEVKIEELGLKDQIREYKEAQQALKKNENRKRRTIRDLENSLQELNEEVASLAGETQRQVRKLTNQDVKINIKD
ncbi:MAG: hypothetical protein ACTSQ0_04130 [Candidatus Heimdallarchaeota archaeon]